MEGGTSFIPRVFFDHRRFTIRRSCGHEFWTQGEYWFWTQLTKYVFGDPDTEMVVDERGVLVAYIFTDLRRCSVLWDIWWDVEIETDPESRLEELIVVPQ